jgi:hypothetical protein
MDVPSTNESLPLNYVPFTVVTDDGHHARGHSSGHLWEV